MFRDNIYLTDDKFLRPSYRISPFRTNDISVNSQLKDSNISAEYLKNRFKDRLITLTTSGREAIHKALIDLELCSDDVVTIITTSNNYYISGCVTSEIEKTCKWSRQFVDNTKAILINHEFGFPVENLEDYKKYKLPIIEDCAHSFISQNKEANVGQVGDYVVFSLPKFFPVQFGGLLVSNREITKDISDGEENYLIDLMSYYIDDLDEIIDKRIRNYMYLSDKIKELGYESKFELKDGYCPGVFIFKSSDMDLGLLKEFMQDHGVECSVFYGEESFFVPVNQALEFSDLDYFIQLIDLFRKR